MRLGIGHYEHRSQPLLPRRLFLRRLAGHGALAIGFLALSLGIGVAGYRFIVGLSWVDAVLEAAMILGGMGPVAPLQTTAGKLFAAAYALYSGVAFLATVGILLAPIVHRLLHRLHADRDSSR
ncbi:MAG: hypothetical protein N3B17_02650 [Chlorobi bacterium]|jgi:hypothetical protein|nr:hypothetical protein [Chlorobiota bacterium]